MTLRKARLRSFLSSIREGMNLSRWNVIFMFFVTASTATKSPSSMIISFRLSSFRSTCIGLTAKRKSTAISLSLSVSCSMMSMNSLAFSIPFPLAMAFLKSEVYICIAARGFFISCATPAAIVVMLASASVFLSFISFLSASVISLNLMSMYSTSLSMNGRKEILIVLISPSPNEKSRSFMLSFPSRTDLKYFLRSGSFMESEKLLPLVLTGMSFVRFLVIRRTS